MWIEKNRLSIRKYETKMPKDTILLHLKADPAVIRQRMAAAPHTHQAHCTVPALAFICSSVPHALTAVVPFMIVPGCPKVVGTAEVEEVQAAFARQFNDSFLSHKVELDTTDLAENDLLAAFFRTVGLMPALIAMPACTMDSATRTHVVLHRHRHRPRTLSSCSLCWRCAVLV